MDEDLQDGTYRLIYILTFVIVFCIVPLVFIVANSDVNRQEIPYECEEPIEVVELIEEGAPSTYNQFKYRLSDGGEYTSTLRYNIGDLVCRKI